jgi:Spy/CpxP family protein refolding chaperone
MKSTSKSMVFGALVAGSLIISAAPVRAWDWPWGRHDERSAHQTDKWDEHWGRGKDYEEYQQARQQALYDASHHASRKKIAEDDARADEILNRGRHGH